MRIGAVPRRTCVDGVIAVIVTITPNPCVDKTVFIDRLHVGEKNRAPRYTCIAGGKGCNVSRAVNAMGGSTLAMPFVGGHTGRHVVEMLTEEDGVRCAPIWVSAMTRTITTILEEPVHRQTAVFEPGPAVTKPEGAAALEQVAAVLSKATVITMNGSAPDRTLDHFYHDVTRMANEAGVKTILDAYGPICEQGLTANPYMVKPNVEEAEQLLGCSINTRADQWAAVDSLRVKGVSLVVLSLGAAGALVACKAGCFHVMPPAIDEVNPVGSGDALVAGFALGLAGDKPIEDTARLGVAMGTANAMSWDIGAFTSEQVNALLPDITITPR